ncbi:hypothetical protein PGTUg99_018570 [Puccinia graminis f. sp. tritici]|uniref:Uncharacterized protein n=1 Tax=Puccinia graminis f. sp. tritici TaxID=56615 RepID=A0A5B0SNP1_PUCGR|nr:hypothetical protein PGTUg99_018570 [Puccinia graminis f. sp. tritici]
MKVSQSFVVVSLSVAAQTQVSMASPLPVTDAGDLSFDSPQLSEAVLAEELPTRLIPKGFGRRNHPSLMSLNPRARAVSLSFDSNGRVNPRAHAQTDRSKLQNSIHIGDTNILNASLGAHRPIRPLASSDEHGLRSSNLLDLSLKMKKRSPDEPKLPAVVQAVSGDVSKPVSETLSTLPIMVEDLSAAKKVLPATPGVANQLAGILGARGVPAAPVSPLSALPLSSLPLLSDLSRSLPANPASSLPAAAAAPATGLPILGSILGARSQLPDPSLAALEGLNPDESLPINPFNPDLLSASDIMAAGGAFPIQPSHSLDGQTLPNEPSIPNFSQLFADAQAIQASGSGVADDASLRNVRATKKHKGSKSHHDDKDEDDSPKAHHDDNEEDDSPKAHHHDMDDKEDAPKSHHADNMEEDDEAALMKKLIEKLDLKAPVPAVAPSAASIETQVVPVIPATDVQNTVAGIPIAVSTLPKKLPSVLPTAKASSTDSKDDDDSDYSPGPKLHRTRTVFNFPHRNSN